MKRRLLAVIVLCTALFFSSLIWLSDSFFYGDRLKWAEMTLRSQVSVTSEAIITEIKSLKKWMASANEFSLSRIDWNAFSPYTAMGVLQRSGESWFVQDFVADPSGNFARITKEIFQSQFATWALKNLHSAPSFFTFTDAQKKVFIVTFLPASDRVWFFVHSGETFQSIIDSQKGSVSSLGVVTKNALTIAHSIPEYQGQMMAKSPLQEELINTNSVNGSGNYNMGQKDKSFVYYQKVPDVDMLVYASMPVEEILKGRKKLIFQLALLSLGLILVLSAFVLKFANVAESESLDMSFVKSLPDPDLTPSFEAVPSEAIVDKTAIQKEKMDAYAKLSSAFGHQLKTPMLAILGYAQNLLAKTTDADAKKTIEALIAEARGTRQTVDKILSFAGEREQDRSAMKLEVPLLRALKNLDPIIEQKKIVISKNFTDTPALYINADGLIQAFENILLNCIESMDKMPNKEIELHLKYEGTKVQLLIKDKGEGILEENLNRVFEPFFTTRASMQKIGLGLSVAHGILKEHAATIEVSSQVGEGTSFLICFEKEITMTKSNLIIEKKETSQIVRSARRTPPEEIKVNIMNIKQYDEVQLIDDEELSRKKPKKERSVDGEERSSEEEAVENLKLDVGAEVTKTMKILRKPTDMDVDQLLDMPEPKIDEDKTQVTNSNVHEMLDLQTNTPSTKPIAPPNKNTVSKVQLTDQFKVNIRRPERKS